MKKKASRGVRKGVGKWLYWTPRVLAIILIAFMAMMSLDVFDGNYWFWGTVLALFMHNIPVFILIIVLVIAWKREIVGAVAFFIGAALYAAMNLVNMLTNPFEWYYLAWIFQISGVAVVIGVLFLMNWKRKRK